MAPAPGRSGEAEAQLPSTGAVPLQELPQDKAILCVSLAMHVGAVGLHVLCIHTYMREAV